MWDIAVSPSQGTARSHWRRAAVGLGGPEDGTGCNMGLGDCWGSYPAQIWSLWVLGDSLGWHIKLSGHSAPQCSRKGKVLLDTQKTPWMVGANHYVWQTRGNSGWEPSFNQLLQVVGYCCLTVWHIFILAKGRIREIIPQYYSKNYFCRAGMFPTRAIYGAYLYRCCLFNSGEHSTFSLPQGWKISQPVCAGNQEGFLAGWGPLGGKIRLLFIRGCGTHIPSVERSELLAAEDAALAAVPSFVPAVPRHHCHRTVLSCAPVPSPLPFFFFSYPFRVENLYLLWECNLFLVDNVTLSGAGSWVSWSDIFR